MTFLYFFAIAIFLFVAWILCLVVLVQEGKGGGLGASLGGGSDASDSLFGTSTPQILKTFTGYLAATFVGLCLILSFWTQSLVRHNVASYSDQQIEQIEQ